nr:MAG TPA: hypothetical protein [Caudoviricetes sp.]
MGSDLTPESARQRMMGPLNRTYNPLFGRFQALFQNIGNNVAGLIRQIFDPKVGENHKGEWKLSDFNLEYLRDQWSGIAGKLEEYKKDQESYVEAATQASRKVREEMWNTPGQTPALHDELSIIFKQFQDDARLRVFADILGVLAVQQDRNQAAIRLESRINRLQQEAIENNTKFNKTQTEVNKRHKALIDALNRSLYYVSETAPQFYLLRGEKGYQASQHGINFHMDGWTLHVRSNGQQDTNILLIMRTNRGSSDMQVFQFKKGRAETKSHKISTLHLTEFINQVTIIRQDVVPKPDLTDLYEQLK